VGHSCLYNRRILSATTGQIFIVPKQNLNGQRTRADPADAVFYLSGDGMELLLLPPDHVARQTVKEPGFSPVTKSSIGDVIHAKLLTRGQLKSMWLRCRSCHALREIEQSRKERQMKYAAMVPAGAVKGPRIDASKYTFIRQVGREVWLCRFY
jgi:hypothetical protein